MTTSVSWLDTNRFLTAETLRLPERMMLLTEFTKQSGINDVNFNFVTRNICHSFQRCIHENGSSILIKYFCLVWIYDQTKNYRMWILFKVHPKINKRGKLEYIDIFFFLESKTPLLKILVVSDQTQKVTFRIVLFICNFFQI